MENMILEAQCRTLGAVIDNNAPMYTMRDCDLWYQQYYTMTVYVEDELGNSDGLISKPLEFFVSFSNIFQGSAGLPSTVRTPQSDKVTLSFTAKNSGAAWGTIVPEYFMNQVRPEVM